MNNIDFSRASSLEEISARAFWDINASNSASNAVLDLSPCTSLKTVDNQAFKYMKYGAVKLPNNIGSWGNDVIGNPGTKVFVEQSSTTMSALISALSSGSDEFIFDDSALTGEYGNLKYAIAISKGNEPSITITGFAEGDVDKSEINIPDEINGMPVTKVANSAFQGKLQSTKKITIGCNVSSIGAYAFDCVQNVQSLLSEIVINDGCTLTIGDRAFQKYGNGTKSITFNANNREIALGNNVFLSSPITSAYMPGVTSMGRGVFYGNGTNLKTLVINGAAECSDNTFVNSTGAASSDVSIKNVSIKNAIIYEIGGGELSSTIESQLKGADNIVCKAPESAVSIDSVADGTTGLVNPTKEGSGLAFDAWYEGNTKLESAAVKGKVYTAKWLSSQYSVVANGETATSVALSTTYGKSDPVTSNLEVSGLGADEAYQATVSGDSRFAVSQNGSQITVTFDPGDSPAAGQYQGALLVATPDGASFNISLTANVAKATPSLSFEGVENGKVSARYGDLKFSHEATVSDLKNGDTCVPSYSSSDPNVATVDADGTIHISYPGKTTITASIADQENYNDASASYELTVGKKLIDLSGVSFGAASATYDGTAKSIVAQGEPSEAKVSYAYADKDGKAVDAKDVVNAGTYTVTATFEPVDSNTCELKDATNGVVVKTATLTINPYQVKFFFNESENGVIDKTFGDPDFTVSVTAKGVNGESVGCVENVGSEARKVVVPVGEKGYSIVSAGTATIEVAVSGNYSNYTGRASFTINVAQAEPTVALADKESVYTGEPIAANAAVVSLNGNAIDGASVTYEYYTNEGCTDNESADAPTAVGNYWVKATFEGSNNLKGASTIAKLTINPAQIEAPAANTTAFVYNGQSQKYFEALDIPSIAGKLAYSVDNNERTDAGTQTVKLKLTDPVNTVWKGANKSDDPEYKFTIAQAEPTVAFEGVADGKVSKAYGDADFAQTATAKGVGSDTLDVSYASSDDKVATVDAAGNVHIVSVGTATISANVAESNNYQAA